MSVAISIEQKLFIREQSAENRSSPDIASALGISVWTVRKWRSHFKKGVN